MTTPALWLLVTAGRTSGMAVPLVARIGEGTRGHAVRRIEVRDASSDLRHSAEIATRLAYNCLHREKYIDRQIIVDYEPGASLINAHGRSADLAFALALAVSHGKRGLKEGCPAVAATGILSDDGAILPVEGLPEKVAAALAVLPPESLILFPAGNDGDLPLETRRLAAARRITFLPSSRLEEALKHIGFAISRTWLDSPFRGLEPFELKHASIFFGRATEIADILSLLERRARKGPATLLVRGPSGSGKSSLVLAGVIPALLRRFVACRPPATSAGGFCARAPPKPISIPREKPRSSKRRCDLPGIMAKRPAFPFARTMPRRPARSTPTHSWLGWTRTPSNRGARAMSGFSIRWRNGFRVRCSRRRSRVSAASSRHSPSAASGSSPR
jgi:hypothetical protein